MTTEDGVLARIGPASITPAQTEPIEDKPMHPRDERENGWHPIDLVDVGDEFALCYELDELGDGYMYTQKTFEGHVHAVHRDGGELFVLVRDDCCDPSDQTFYVYKPNRFISCDWNHYDDGWRDEWAPECDDKAGESFGSPVAACKGEKNVPTEWWVIKD